MISRLGVKLFLLSTILLAITATPIMQKSSTPSRNDKPVVVYMGAFFDPKYHDNSPDQFLPPKKSPQEEEEEAVLLQKIKLLKNAKLFKRGIDNSVDFKGTGDSLAMESGHEEKTPEPTTTKRPRGKIMVKIIEKSKKVKKHSNNDQVQTASHSIKQEPAKQEQQQVVSSFNPYQPQNYFDTYQNSILGPYIDQWKDDLVYGRRKLRGYYRRPHRTPSFGQVFLEMKGKVGYW